MNFRNENIKMLGTQVTLKSIDRVYKLEGRKTRITAEFHHLLFPHDLLDHHLRLLAHRTGKVFWVWFLAEMHVFILLQTTLLTEIFKLSLISNGSQEALATTDILLTITADFQPLFVILQAHVGTELLDVRAEPDAVLAQAGCLHVLLARGAIGHTRLILTQAILVTKLHGFPNNRMEYVGETPGTVGASILPCTFCTFVFSFYWRMCSILRLLAWLTHRREACKF